MSQAGRFSRALALSLLLVSGPRARAAELLPVPRPDLTTVAEEIGRQIEALEALIASLSERPGGGLPALAEAYGTLGQLYHLYEMRQPAEACYRNARALTPGDPRWPYSLALLHSAAGEVEEAIRRLEETLALRPDDLPSLIRLGRLQLDADRVALAAATFRQALELEPSAAAAYGAGQAAAVLGDDRAAIANFDKALELQPDASIIHYPLAQALRRVGESERARFHLERRGLREVGFPDPVFEQLNDMSTLAAFQLVKTMAGNTERFSEAELLGYALSLLSNVEGTIAQFEQLLAAGSTEGTGRDTTGRARLHYVVGGLLVHRGLDARAMPHFRAAIALAPSLQDARIKLANVLARGRAYREAVAQLSIVLEKEPSRTAARMKRGAALVAMGRPFEAQRDLEMVVQIEPKNAQALFRLAVALEQLGSAEAAIERYLAAARHTTVPGQKALAHYRIGRLLRLEEDLGRARSQYELALEAEPQLVEARLELAHSLVQLGELEAAARNYRLAIGLQPRLDEARQGEAAALILLARYGEARQRLEEGLAEMPDSLTLAALQARLLAGSPDSDSRDGQRALILAQTVYEAQRTPHSAETLAMAYAQAGRLEDAARLLREVLAEPVSDELAERLREKLRSYASGRDWYPGSPRELLP